MKHVQFQIISTSSDQSHNDHENDQALTCGACKESYDLNDKLPFVICQNYHILCRRCTFKLYVQHANNQSIQCEFCQTLLQWPQFSINLINLLKLKTISRQTKLNQQMLNLCDFSIQQAVRTILIENQDLQGEEVEVEEEVMDWPCFIGQSLQTNKLYQFKITSTIDEIIYINLGFTIPQDLVILSFEDNAVLSRQGICYTHYNNQSIQEIINTAVTRLPSESHRITIRMKMDVTQQLISWFLQDQNIFSLSLPHQSDEICPYFEYKYRCQFRTQ